MNKTSELILKETLERITRIECRLVQLMQYLKADKNGRYESLITKTQEDKHND